VGVFQVRSWSRFCILGNNRPLWAEMTPGFPKHLKKLKSLLFFFGNTPLWEPCVGAPFDGDAQVGESLEDLVGGHVRRLPLHPHLLLIPLLQPALRRQILSDVMMKLFMIKNFRG